MSIPLPIEVILKCYITGIHSYFYHVLPTGSSQEYFNVKTTENLSIINSYPTRPSSAHVY